ncbi:hypothetical protein EV356DRAFT_442255 [Viridothelium virens]|uniref:AB hydrolase-1 domain-containing protein n=1 Tax=Viridothelium virens TaxID=1048519 RepID=A0A6A6HGB7_VIRVR|nr:hypothetical protein EV356DRAFT_442255 [Viridothelium virens]
MSLLTLLALTLGTTTARKCQNITVPIDISARVGIFNIQAPASDIDTTNFFLNDTQQGHNFTQEILEGYRTISGKYNLAATYCAPDSGHGKVAQVLTHGIGFDRSYWDLSYNNYNYSYVETAVDQYDFSTVTWDRLGIGMSSHGDPVSAIQEPLEEAALHALTKMTRNGELPGIDCKFDKVVHVGHSFGSVISYSLTRDYPTASDGLILTGFSGNATFLAYFALGGNFVLANTIPHLSAYPAGYFAAGDASGVQTNFFAPGDFDPNILELGFQTQQPVTAGEILTIAASGVNHFAGPVIVITGERDVPFCGGDCLATGNPALPNIPDDVKPDFPNASVFKTFIVPASGHGLNLEYSHKTTYHVAQQFLNENGL